MKPHTNTQNSSVRTPAAVVDCQSPSGEDDVGHTATPARMKVKWILPECRDRRKLTEKSASGLESWDEDVKLVGDLPVLHSRKDRMWSFLLEYKRTFSSQSLGGRVKFTDISSFCLPPLFSIRNCLPCTCYGHLCLALITAYGSSSLLSVPLSRPFLDVSICLGNNSLLSLSLSRVILFLLFTTPQEGKAK